MLISAQGATIIELQQAAPVAAAALQVLFKKEQVIGFKLAVTVDMRAPDAEELRSEALAPTVMRTNKKNCIGFRTDLVAAATTACKRMKENGGQGERYDQYERGQG